MLTSCKKFVEVGAPETEIATSTVFNSDATATAAMTGIYGSMVGSTAYFGSGGSDDVNFLCGFAADELICYETDNDDQEFYTNSLIPTNGELNTSLWSTPYTYIYDANSVIEGLSGSKNVDAETKQQLIGEAEFIRAYCNLYMVNLFGNIPLVTSISFQTNTSLPRASKAEVYQQVIADLKDAQNKLESDYSFSSGQKTRPNKWAATALLARTYLYMGDWADAQTQASNIINSGTYTLVKDLNGVFLANSSEAIFQLMPVVANQNTNEGHTFILTTTPSTASLSTQLLAAFEPGDARRISWVDSITVIGTKYYYPYKYKIATSTGPPTEYSMVLRLAEQYLIRAEAEANGATGGIAAAINDLNVIRNRAGLPNYVGVTDKTSLLNAILHERQVELFTEGGHRWIDLIRTGNVNSVMNSVTPRKGGGAWKSYQALFPIPQAQISADPNDTQNLGY